MPLRPLRAVVCLPFATASGRVVCRPGYDEETGLLLHLPRDYTLQVPEKPTPDQVEAAVVQLMRPWRAYTWASPDDAAAAVAAVFLAVCRPVLDIAPAVLVDAAAQASGKTKAAQAIGALLSGRREAVLPFSGVNEEELGKQLIAGVRRGQVFYLWDNMTGHVKSPTLAAVLTSGRLSGRVLGESRDVDAEFAALFTMTGNNASVDADLTRRSLRLRIDSGANPAQRRFDFDPVAVALAERLKIAEAACTIWRAYFAAGAPRIASDDLGGFSAFNTLCRQCVLWLASEGMAEGLGWQLGDPGASMLADASGSDPEIEAHGDLLLGLNACADGAAFDARTVGQWFKAGEHDDDAGAFALVRSAVHELLNLRGGQEPSPRSLGRMLMNRRDRVVGGLQLRQRPDRHAGSSLWRVVPA